MKYLSSEDHPGDVPDAHKSLFHVGSVVIGGQVMMDAPKVVRSLAERGFGGHTLVAGVGHGTDTYRALLRHIATRITVSTGVYLSQWRVADVPLECLTDIPNAVLCSKNWTILTAETSILL